MTCLRLLIIPAFLGLSACKDLWGCDDILIFGIRAEVADAATGAPISGAMGVAREGNYVDTLRAFLPDRSILMGVGERPGNYRVDVTAPGYQPWVRSNIWVLEDRCHVDTRVLAVQLTPQ